MTRFDDALRREIRRHADSGLRPGEARSKIEADALAAGLAETLADFVHALTATHKAARRQVPGDGRWRKRYSPAGYMLHQEHAAAHGPAATDDALLLKRLTLITPDARIWSWVRNHGHQPAFDGFVPVTGEALKQRQIWLDGGTIGIGTDVSGAPAAIHHHGDPPFEPIENVLARIAQRLIGDQSERVSRP